MKREIKNILIQDAGHEGYSVKREVIVLQNDEKEILRDLIANKSDEFSDEDIVRGVWIGVLVELDGTIEEYGFFTDSEFENGFSQETLTNLIQKASKCPFQTFLSFEGEYEDERN